MLILQMVYGSGLIGELYELKPAMSEDLSN